MYVFVEVDVSVVLVTVVDVVVLVDVDVDVVELTSVLVAVFVQVLVVEVTRMLIVSVMVVERFVRVVVYVVGNLSAVTCDVLGVDVPVEVAVVVSVPGLVVLVEADEMKPTVVVTLGPNG